MEFIKLGYSNHQIEGKSYAVEGVKIRAFVENKFYYTGEGTEMEKIANPQSEWQIGLYVDKQPIYRTKKGCVSIEVERQDLTQRKGLFKKTTQKGNIIKYVITDELESFYLKNYIKNLRCSKSMTRELNSLFKGSWYPISAGLE